MLLGLDSFYLGFNWEPNIDQFPVPKVQSLNITDTCQIYVVLTLMWAFLDWVGKANILLQVNENQL